jgi:FkbM family methyltransferase
MPAQRRLKALELAGLSLMSRAFGALPPGCGQGTVALSVQRRYQRGGPLRTQRMATGALLELDLAEPQQLTAYLTRRYQHDLVALIIKLLPKGGLFVDVGANIGLVSFSVAASRPDVSVLAFEPEAENAARWLRNAALNDARRSRLETIALGAEVGHKEIVRGPESGQSRIATEGEHGVCVPIDTLDSYASRLGLQNINVLKVDVEGYEPFVFQGASNLLREGRIDAIVSEVNEPLLRHMGFTRSQLRSLLGEHGFEPHLIPPTGARKLRNQPALEEAGDLVFTREDIPSRPLSAAKQATRHAC